MRFSFFARVTLPLLAVLAVSVAPASAQQVTAKMNTVEMGKAFGRTLSIESALGASQVSTVIATLEKAGWQKDPQPDYHSALKPTCSVTLSGRPGDPIEAECRSSHIYGGVVLHDMTLQVAELPALIERLYGNVQKTEVALNTPPDLR